MNSPFREFFHNEVIDFRNLNSDIIIIFDTNTLLNIYRYSNETRNKLIDIMTSIQNNIWIPYQIGLEFNLQRRNVIADLKKEKDSLPQEIKSNFTDLNKNIRSIISKIKLKSTDALEMKHSVLSTFETSLSTFENEVIKNVVEILSLVDLEEDLAGSFGSIFEGRIGNCYTQDELNLILEKAPKRFEFNIPPGYKDKNKTEIVNYNGVTYPKKYGDLILWHQILDKAREESISKVVFITDDNKEDWWYRIAGKTIGPRAELKNEMLRISQADFFMFNSNSFLNQFELEKSNLIIEDIDLNNTKTDLYNYYKEFLFTSTEEDENINNYKWLLFRKKDVEVEKMNIESQIYDVERRNILLEKEFINTMGDESDQIKELIIKNHLHISSLKSELEETLLHLDALEQEIIIYEKKIDENINPLNKMRLEFINKKWEH